MGESTALTRVLFPGRHHVLTRFQAWALREILEGRARDLEGETVEMAPAACVVWALTSANHHNTRRNPVAFHRRSAAIERFALMESIPSRVAAVFDTVATERFAEITLKAVEAEAVLSPAVLTPSDTIVACSTPAVVALYQELGFRVVGLELEHPEQARPWDVLELLVANDSRWLELAHPASSQLLLDYGLDERVRMVCSDPVVGSDGALTETRAYRTYIESFELAAERKWAQALPYIQPGRVLDIGCATGAMLELAADEPQLHESDLYGVEVARHLYEECVHKKAQGVFSNPNTFFLMHNMLSGPALAPRSVDTTLSFALTHEIFSYGQGLDSLERFAQIIHDQAVAGGVWINSDVCGPEDGTRLVELVLDQDDGTPLEAPLALGGLSNEEVAQLLEPLSTRARFVQFAADFARHARVSFEHEMTEAGARLSLADAMEFLTKKDYVDNWMSETHERFCALSWSDWEALAGRVGLELDPRSGPWRNEWLVTNRLSVGASIRELDGTPTPWPDTHVLLVARRSLNS